MFFVVRPNDSFNFPLGLIKYIVLVIVNLLLHAQSTITVPGSSVFLGWSEGPWRRDLFKTSDLCSGTLFFSSSQVVVDMGWGWGLGGMGPGLSMFLGWAEQDPGERSFQGVGPVIWNSSSQTRTVTAVHRVHRGRGEHEDLRQCSDLPCSHGGQKDPWGEILSRHRTCDLELSFSVRHLSSCSSFKSELKTHLFSSAY